MAVVFTVVGEHRDDPDRLLVIGDDGATSELSLPTGQLIPVEPTGEEWKVTPPPPALDDSVLDFDGI